MASLGEFKAAKREADPNREPDTFTLEGEVFTVADRDLTIVMAEFAHAASSGLDTADMEGLAAMLDLLRGVVIEEDQPRLIALSKKVGLDGETLMEIVKVVVEANAGVPTQRQSGSQPGLSPTGPSSRGPSSSGVSVDPRREGLEPVETAALSLLTG